MPNPPDLALEPNDAKLAAGTKPDGTPSSIALDADSKLLVGGSALPTGAATEAKQDNIITILGPSTPVSSVDAYVGSMVLKNSGGVLRSVHVQLNPSLPQDTYYVLLMAGSATVPADGAVTLLRAPAAIRHLPNSVDDYNFDEGEAGIPFSTGLSVCISTTQFTKTEVATAALFDGSVR